MAKSKAGGTRSYLRGRIASDVYSVGKDAKGKKQQVVRSLAEQVANPQTLAQMAQRMRLASVAQLAHVLRPFIDHSFDNVPVGQPNVSEFVRGALAAYKEDSEKATPAFGYLNYGSKNYPTAEVPVSFGKVKIPFRWNEQSNNSYTAVYGKAGFAFCDTDWPITIPEGAQTPADNYTVGQFVKHFLGGSVEGYLTFVAIGKAGQAADAKPAMHYLRIGIKPGVSLDTIIHAGDLDNTIFALESDVDFAGFFSWGENWATNFCPTFTWDAKTMPSGSFWANGALCIVTSKQNGKFIHSTSKLRTTWYDDSTWAEKVNPRIDVKPYNVVDAAYATALATYPLGTERFLNGGEL